MKNITRRRFLNLAVGSAVAVAIPTTGCSSKVSIRRSASEKPPNIIFIMADDLGYGDLGCYGQENINTPNIDQLAAYGNRFTQCYAGSTVCAPSRSVLMTGQHTGHTRVRGNSGKVAGVGPQKRVPLKGDDVTVAEVLKKAGYVTAITGKWGLGEPQTTGIPSRQGFDEWLGYLNQRNAHSYYPPYLWRNEQKIILEGNKNGQQKQYSHDLFTDFALDFIRRRSNKRFFLYLPYTIPHAKYQIPGTWPYSDKPWPKDARVHAAMITRMDRDVGRIITLLQKLKIDKDTLVFFCSDNGAASRWEGLFDSSGPLRGCKRDLYEGGIRTQMIVRWPGMVPAGKVSDAVWYFADVLPPLAELAGLDPPHDIDGINILPTLLGKQQKTHDRFLYWEFFERGFQQAVRWRNYKAVRAKRGAPLELYDLAGDPGEKHNIAAKHSDVTAAVEHYLRTARTDSPNWPVGKPKE